MSIAEALAATGAVLAVVASLMALTVGTSYLERPVERVLTLLTLVTFTSSVLLIVSGIWWSALS